MAKIKIILDTNFLMIPHQFGVDIFEYLKDCEIETMSPVVTELKRLARKKNDDGIAARIAMKLIKDNKIRIIKSKEKADKAILNHAVREKCAVATNDKALIQALKSKGVKIIRLKQKKYLAEEG